jgi:tetrathionate reductase subunit B
MKPIKNHNRRDFLKAGTLVAGTSLVSLRPSLLLAAQTQSGASGAKRRWSFLVDLERCTGCKACAVACKTEFSVPLGVFRSSVKEYDSGRFPETTRDFVPWLCNHCEKPICLTECPVDEIEGTFTWPDGTVETFLKRATFKRPDGVVLVDYDRCIGCGACVDLCPYGVRFLNPARKNSDGDEVADKCTLCAHRLEAGSVPACVNTCPTEARLVGDINDPNSEISRRMKGKTGQVLLPDKGTQPNCHYLALNPKAYLDGRDTK